MLSITFARVGAAVAVREAASKRWTLLQPHGRALCLGLSDHAGVSQELNPEAQEMKALTYMHLSWELLGDSSVSSQFLCFKLSCLTLLCG